MSFSKIRNPYTYSANFLRDSATFPMSREDAARFRVVLSKSLAADDTRIACLFSQAYQNRVFGKVLSDDQIAPLEDVKPDNILAAIYAFGLEGKMDMKRLYDALGQELEDRPVAPVSLSPEQIAYLPDLVRLATIGACLENPDYAEDHAIHPVIAVFTPLIQDWLDQRERSLFFSELQKPSARHVYHRCGPSSSLSTTANPVKVSTPEAGSARVGSW